MISKNSHCLNNYKRHYKLKKMFMLNSQAKVSPRSTKIKVRGQQIQNGIELHFLTLIFTALLPQLTKTIFKPFNEYKLANQTTYFLLSSFCNCGWPYTGRNKRIVNNLWLFLFLQDWWGRQNAFHFVDYSIFHLKYNSWWHVTFLLPIGIKAGFFSDN